MPKTRKTGRKSYSLTKALERRIMDLAIKAVRADWATESAKLNLRSVETPASEAPSAPPATQGWEVGIGTAERHWSEVGARQTFGVAERTDPSEVVRQMQRQRGDRCGYVHLTCVRPNPEQIAEGIAAAADHLAQTDEAPGGGGQIAPPPANPAPQAAFDAAVAANKAIFSLREAPPFQKNNIFRPTYSDDPEPWADPPPPSDTTTDGTHSGETGPAKNEKFWGSPVDKTGPYHDWSVHHEPAVVTDELERAMLDDGLIECALAPRAPGSAPGFLGGLSPEQRAAALAHRGEDTAFADPLERAMVEDGLILRPAWVEPPKALTDLLTDVMGGGDDPVEGQWYVTSGGQWWQTHYDAQGGEWVVLAPGRPPAAEKNDSPPANTHLGTMPGGQPLGPPKVNAPRTWWETIMADIEALPRGNQLTLSPWQVRQLYDQLHAWGYRSARRP